MCSLLGQERDWSGTFGSGRRDPASSSLVVAARWHYVDLPDD